jgi:hypothetical protein
MSDPEIINEEPVINEPQTSEDKFFGVTSEVNTDTPDEIQVEIIDDTPEEDRRPQKAKDSGSKVNNDDVDAEISDYSQRAADRINQIKYEFHEERRAKEQAERINTEAATRLNAVLQENQRLQEMVSKGGEVLNQSAHNNALWAKQSATEAYKKAYDEGDADAMAKAQELLAKATLAEQQAGGTAQQVQAQIAQNLQQQLAQQPQQPQVPQPQEQRKLDPDMEKWASKNPWFMNTSNAKHNNMTSYAMYVDTLLTSQGIDPATNSEQYYLEVDKAMQRQFPDFFGVQAESDSGMSGNAESPKRQPQTVVASATRDSGNKKPTQIRLTKTQVDFARQLGISPEKYATQVLRES